MEVKVLKKNANELKIEIVGVGHGFCNLIQKKILEDENVDLAGYDVPHPLASNPVIYVRMKGNAKPEDTLIAVAKKASESNAAFSEALTAALKV